MLIDKKNILKRKGEVNRKEDLELYFQIEKNIENFKRIIIIIMIIIIIVKNNSNYKNRVSIFHGLKLIVQASLLLHCYIIALLLL